MSRWWPEFIPWQRAALRVLISPFELQVGAQPRRTLPPPQDLLDWRPVLAALEQALEAAGGGRGALEVVLSNHFVRYVVVPWDEQISDEAEFDTYVMHRLGATYGAAAHSWLTCSADLGPHRAAVVAAMEAGLLVQLRELAARQHLRLRSVVPALAHDFRRFRGALPDGDFWFAQAEPQRLCLARARNGQWDSVRNLHAPEGVVEALLSLLAQDVWSEGLERERVRIHLCGFRAAEAGALRNAGWEPLVLERGAREQSIEAVATAMEAR